MPFPEGLRREGWWPVVGEAAAAGMEGLRRGGTAERTEEKGSRAMRQGGTGRRRGPMETSEGALAFCKEKEGESTFVSIWAVIAILGSVEVTALISYFSAERDIIKPSGFVDAP